MIFAPGLVELDEVVSDQPADQPAGYDVRSPVRILLDARNADQRRDRVGRRCDPGRVVMSSDHRSERERTGRMSRGEGLVAAK